jgi:hypothetical protein
MSIHFLKVKIKSLAEEAKIIRHEEHLVYANRAARKRWRQIKLGQEPAGEHTNSNRFSEQDVIAAVDKVKASRGEIPNIKAPARHSEAHRNLYLELQNHRKLVVRPEARATLLAYGFLRGRHYKDIEGKRHEIIDSYTERVVIDKAIRMTHKYGEKVGTLEEVAITFWGWMELALPKNYMRAFQTK